MNVCYVLAVLHPLGIERNFSSLSFESKWKSFGFYQERFWFLPEATAPQNCSLDKERFSHFVQFYFFSKLNFFLSRKIPFRFLRFQLILFYLNPKSILIGANIKKGRESKNFSRARKNIFLVQQKKKRFKHRLFKSFFEFLSET